MNKLEIVLQKQWKRAQLFTELCLKDNSAKSIIINWMNTGWGLDDRFTIFWTKLVNEELKNDLEQLRSCEKHSDLSFELKGTWRQRISSAPWVALKFNGYSKHFD